MDGEASESAPAADGYQGANSRGPCGQESSYGQVKTETKWRYAIET